MHAHEKGRGRKGKIRLGTIARISCPRGMCGMSSLGQLHKTGQQHGSSVPRQVLWILCSPTKNGLLGVYYSLLPARGVAKTVGGGFAS